MSGSVSLASEDKQPKTSDWVAMVVGVFFIAGALGVRWGEHRAAQRICETACGERPSAYDRASSSCLCEVEAAVPAVWAPLSPLEPASLAPEDAAVRGAL